MPHPILMHVRLQYQTIGEPFEEDRVDVGVGIEPAVIEAHRIH